MTKAEAIFNFIVVTMSHIVATATEAETMIIMAPTISVTIERCKRKTAAPRQLIVVYWSERSRGPILPKAAVVRIDDC